MQDITHLFEIDEKKYVYDYRNIFFSLVDNNVYSIMKKSKDGEADLDFSENPVWGLLIKSGYFKTNEAELSPQRFAFHANSTMNISFAPVHDCNFACTYCYASGGQSTKNYEQSFTKEKIDRLLDYIYIEKYPYYQNYQFDFVSGGEPLLNMGLLEYFLHQVRLRDDANNKRTTVLIVTNGTLLTVENINTLDTYDVFLGISIDGPEKVHNRYRVYRDGSGTYQDVAKGILRLKSSNASSKLKEAWAMSVITKETSSLVETMENAISLGFVRMQMQLMREKPSSMIAFKPSDLTKTQEKYLELFDHILQFVKIGDLSRLKMIANNNDSFGKFLGRLLLKRTVAYRCSAGKNKISITASGEVYPCDSFCNIAEFEIDNLHQSSITTIGQEFLDAHVQNRTPCSTCWAKRLCGGDCFYSSYMMYGDIYKPNPFACAMNRFFIERAIDMLMQIQRIDANHIAYMAKFLRLR